MGASPNRLLTSNATPKSWMLLEVTCFVSRRWPGHSWRRCTWMHLLSATSEAALAEAKVQRLNLAQSRWLQRWHRKSWLAAVSWLVICGRYVTASAHSGLDHPSAPWPMTKARPSATLVTLLWASSCAACAGFQSVDVSGDSHWATKLSQFKARSSLILGGYIGIMENKMKTTIVYRDYIGL